MKLLLILLLAIAIPACRSSQPVDQAAERATPSLADSNQSNSASTAALLTNLPPAQIDRAAFPVTVENCGRKLTFEQPPQRVISLWQPANELLLAIGVQQQMIGLAGNYTNLPASLIESAKSIPVLGTATRWPTREVMLTQNPDLVVSEGLEGFAFDPAEGYATVAELEQAGAQVFSTGSSCTPQQVSERGISAVYDDLRDLGQIFGVSARATALIERLQQREAAIRQRVSGRDRTLTLFYNGGEGPLAVLTSGVWADAIDKAGGESVLARMCFKSGLRNSPARKRQSF
ncbi:MAG: ABC transporter substrate-binding protein [Leptolyngbyaceae cyanobacterium SM1_3_5]|nr:ABC transporter substrate-binding protein [Leptolyngbyaceae cyanobacterium SM1_3_5]